MNKSTRSTTPFSRFFMVGVFFCSMVFCNAVWAQCPASPAPPWFQLSALQGTGVIVPGGYEGSSCRFRVSLNQNSSPGAKAFVLDQSPSSEPRYRARFVIDPSNLSLTQTNRNAVVFSILGTSAPAGGSARLMTIALTGNGTRPILRISAGNTDLSSQYTLTDVVLPNQAGPNRVEIDLVIGANSTGSLKYWVSNASTSTSESNPTGVLTGLSNNAWGGSDQVTLGLSSTSTFWRQGFSNTQYLYLDQFESRRMTFMGL